MPDSVPLGGLAPVLTAVAVTFALASALAFHGVARRRLSPRAAVAGAACLSILFLQAGPAAAAALVFLYAALAASERLLLRRTDRERRGATQVLANLGPAVAFSLLPLLPVAFPGLEGLSRTGERTGFTGSALREVALCAALAALAASLSDSISSAAGRRYGGQGIFLLSRSRGVAGEPSVPGLSGQVTVAGAGAGVAAALLFAALATVASDLHVQEAYWFPARGFVVFLSVVAGGVTGNLVDSLAGEAVQFKGRCAVCGALIEETEHCGTLAERVSGFRSMRNGGVNVLGSSVGGLVGGLVAVAFSYTL